MISLFVLSEEHQTILSFQQKLLPQWINMVPIQYMVVVFADNLISRYLIETIFACGPSSAYCIWSPAHVMSVSFHKNQMRLAHHSYHFSILNVNTWGFCISIEQTTQANHMSI